ncbi:MAG TPA: pyrroloquinoline quinone biosynthesis protein PqqB [Candidatus Competibacteraceae bacterium]|nr:pyrroloquinoline quinone biosynthesis protein PqqB [Candidatus Competibacteraceae bacterium]
MHIRILGSAAGGGFPQWNCNCRNCAGLRAGILRARPRTQSSLTVSGDGQNWLLINASPDIRAQLAAFAPLQPGRRLRDTAIAAVLLMDSQIDHVSGLLALREGPPIRLYCSDPVYHDLTSGLPLIGVLGHYCGVERRPVPLDGCSFAIAEVPGLRLTAVALSSMAPPYSPHRHDPHPGDNLGLLIEDEDSGRRVFYAPGLGEIEPHLQPYLESADALLVDGTFWREDEMILAGVGHKLAAEMGHLPQSGRGGMIEVLRSLRGRKILIHINNTNPILDEDSPERAELVAAGIEVAYDGMDIIL